MCYARPSASPVIVTFHQHPPTGSSAPHRPPGHERFRRFYPPRNRSRHRMPRTRQTQIDHARRAVGITVEDAKPDTICRPAPRRSAGCVIFGTASALRQIVTRRSWSRLSTSVSGWAAGVERPRSATALSTRPVCGGADRWLGGDAVGPAVGFGPRHVVDPWSSPGAKPWAPGAPIRDCHGRRRTAGCPRAGCVSHRKCLALSTFVAEHATRTRRATGPACPRRLNRACSAVWHDGTVGG